MKIGVVGLGKLGLPWALAVQDKGHEVLGYDVKLPKPKGIELAPISKIVAEAELIFVIVQTPHKPQFEGTVRLTKHKADFDYTYLKEAVKDLADMAYKRKRKTTLVVVSTCLPGTFEREIKQLLNEYVYYLYSPSFTAAGTVAEDLYNAEFNLIGLEEGTNVSGILKQFYATLNDAECIKTDIATAEAIKVSYNTYVTFKTVLANLWGEIAAKMDLRFEDIHRAWELSTKRLMSSAYLQAGMSDGGACHPRDNIALSWLAQELGLSHDLFHDIMKAREDYEDWHAQIAIRASEHFGLPLIILGKAFKPETDIETGSAAILMANLIAEKNYPFEHHEDLKKLPVAVYFIATNHERYKRYAFPVGSIVINPAGKDRVE